MGRSGVVSSRGMLQHRARARPGAPVEALATGVRVPRFIRGVFGRFRRRMGALAAYWERTGDDEHRPVD